MLLPTKDRTILTGHPVKPFSRVHGLLMSWLPKIHQKQAENSKNLLALNRRCQPFLELNKTKYVHGWMYIWYICIQTKRILPFYGITFFIYSKKIVIDQKGKKIYDIIWIWNDKFFSFYKCIFYSFNIHAFNPLKKRAVQLY